MQDRGGDAVNDAVDDAESQASERRFRTALSSMVDPVAVVTAVTATSGRGKKRGDVVDFIVSYANGRPGTPRVGTLLSQLWSPGGYKSLLTNFRRLLEGSEDLAV